MKGPVVVALADAAQASALEKVLTLRGFQVHSTGDGDRALELARARTAAVVVVDIELDGLNGFQVCRQLKDEAVVVFYAERNEPADLLWAREVGAADYFRRPSEQARLADRLAELVEGG